MPSFCPNCQAALDPDSRFCQACSVPVVDSSALSPAATPDTSAHRFNSYQSTQSRICPKCRAPLGATATFCGSCGSTLGSSRRKTAIVIAAVVFGLAVITGLAFYFYGSSGRSGSGLYPVVQKGKHGYMDKIGKIVINPQFDDAGLFFEGLAPVSVGRKYGYINTKGEYVINPQFEMAAPFSEGLAAVITGDKPENRKLGYIDRTGKMIIDPQFDAGFGPSGESAWMTSFSEGLALVQLGNRAGYIDKTGKLIINPQFDMAFPFSDGLAAVMVGAKWGYVDKSGKIIINPQFDRAMPFSEGLGLIYLEGKWGYVDKIGKLIINPQFDAATPFSEEGLAGVRVGDKWGGIDKTGKIVINPQFDGNIFSSGPGGFGMAGQIVAHDLRRITFSEGLAGVEVGDKYGYVDKTGQYVINPQFDAAFPFNEGLAMVNIGGKIGYIDKTGKYIWNPTD